MRPAISRVAVLPTVTTVIMSTVAGSSAASVVKRLDSSAREALRTTPTGVVGSRCSARIASALGSCQSRPRLRGL